MPRCSVYFINTEVVATAEEIGMEKRPRGEANKRVDSNLTDLSYQDTVGGDGPSYREQNYVDWKMTER